MIRILSAVLVFVTLAGPAPATDLFATTGAWIGEGRLAIGPTAPLERGRCKVDIAADASGQDLSLTGRCAVAAGLSDISLRLVRGQGGEVRAGVWTAATGETVQFAGRETADVIILTARAPLLRDEMTYDARIEVAALEPALFSMRQLLRAEGETAWRLVADMTYRPVTD